MTGAEFERYVGQVFHDNGHHAAVTKATGDYGVDLILNGYIAVQVKKYSSPVGPKAVQEVVAGKAHYKCTEAWVVTNSTFTSAAAMLADSNGVRLIAGEELQWLAENPDQTADHRERYKAAMAAEAAAERKSFKALMAERRGEVVVPERDRMYQAHFAKTWGRVLNKPVGSDPIDAEQAPPEVRHRGWGAK
jgi:restriction endonuclease Mrr